MGLPLPAAMPHKMGKLCRGRTGRIIKVWHAPDSTERRGGVTHVPWAQTDKDSWEWVTHGSATVAPAVQMAVVAIGVPPQRFRTEIVSSREIGGSRA